MNPAADQPADRYVTCRCQNCDGGIEFDGNELAEENCVVPCPHCGSETKLYAPEPTTKSLPVIRQAGLPEIHIPPRTNSPPPTLKRKRKSVSYFTQLTEETIRARTKKGDTPLHRAAKAGKIHEIPRHLLQTELFMAKNNSFSRETPLHIAARYGHLDQVPPEFLTKETLTASTEYENKESRTGSKPPRTETPLHTAARYGHADQIPKEFLTPEFLSIEASGYRSTVLHDVAYSNSLHLIPKIYASSEMWNLRNSQDQTPLEVLENKNKSEGYVASVRNPESLR